MYKIHFTKFPRTFYLQSYGYLEISPSIFSFSLALPDTGAGCVLACLLWQGGSIIPLF